jgi:hypothetical protein
VNVDLDASELNLLAAQLRGKAGAVGADAAAVVRKGALNVKNDARKLSSGLGHAPLYPFSIGFDVTGDGRFGSIEAEIGPDKEKPQGALGNLLEYGSVNNAPLAHLGPALDREGPRFADALEEIAGEVFP